MLVVLTSTIPIPPQATTQYILDRQPMGKISVTGGCTLEAGRSREADGS